MNVLRGEMGFYWKSSKSIGGHRRIAKPSLGVRLFAR